MLSRLLPAESARTYMAKESKITSKQLAFIIQYARNGMDVIPAYRKAFNNKNDDTCYTEGNRLLKLPKLEKELKKHKTSLERKAARLGMNDNQLLSQHKKLIFATKEIPIKTTDKEGKVMITMKKVDDLAMVKQGLELIYKLLGKNAAERKSFEGPGGKSLFPESDYSKLSNDEVLEKRDALLKALQGIDT